MLSNLKTVRPLSILLVLMPFAIFCYLYAKGPQILLPKIESQTIVENRPTKAVAPEIVDSGLSITYESVAFSKIR